jgi:hypothetical protein
MTYRYAIGITTPRGLERATVRSLAVTTSRRGRSGEEPGRLVQPAPAHCP